MVTSPIRRKEDIEEMKNYFFANAGLQGLYDVCGRN